jgi:hypothetical protein
VLCVHLRVCITYHRWDLLRILTATLTFTAARLLPGSGFRWVEDGNSLLLFGGYYKEMKHKKLYDSSKAAGGKAVDDPDEPSEVGTAYNDGTQPIVFVLAH